MSLNNGGGAPRLNSSHTSIAPFPDPFCDYSSLAMPENLRAIMDFCERVAYANPIYLSALNRIAGFFITEVELSGCSRDEQQKYKTVLNDDLGVHSWLRQVALDYLVTGNSFTSVLIKFRRSLSCPNSECAFEMPLSALRNHPGTNFRWTGYGFHAKCPKCHQQGSWEHNDRRSSSPKDLILKRWAPKEIEILQDPYSGQCKYAWKIPEYYKAMVKTGEDIHLENCPWEVIETVKANGWLGFDKDFLYHMREPALAGVNDRGWGMPRGMHVFRQLWYSQVLHRAVEACGLELVMPLRCVVPDVTGNGGGDPSVSDPMLTANLSGFAAHMEHIVREHRIDPTTVHVSPWAFKYIVAGAEAKQVLPAQLIELARDDLLNGIGVPIDFYKGSMTVQAAPLALRLMESNWSHLTHALNRQLQWLVDRISVLMSWGPVTAKIAKPSHIDDINRQLAKLQLMGMQEISRTSGLGSVGLVYEEERRRQYEEQQFEAELARDTQKKIERGSLGDMMAQPQPPPGDPAAAGAAPPAGAPAGGQAGMMMPPDPVAQILASLPGIDQQLTLPEVDQLSSQIAEQAFFLQPTQRNSLLRQMKPKNEAVHALVKSRLDAKKSQAEAQGRAQQEQAAAYQSTQQVQPAA